MTSYQDEHAPIKFMTGVSLNTRDRPLEIAGGGGGGDFYQKKFLQGKLDNSCINVRCVAKKKRYVSVGKKKIRAKLVSQKKNCRRQVGRKKNSCIENFLPPPPPPSGYI